MFALPGLTLLFLVDVFKPQQYVPQLAGVPVLHLLAALTLLGFAVDVRLGLSRLVAAPQLGIALAFVAWAALSNLPNGAGQVTRQTYALLVPFMVFLLTAHAVQSFRGLQWMMGVVLATGLVLAAVGTHQGLAPWGCHRIQYAAGNREAIFDGRSCTPEERRLCESGDAEPGTDYVCERVGVLGTSSIGGRVRFLGTIEDPNELALLVGAVIPIAFALRERRRSAARLALLLATMGLVGACVYFTQSRGGQLVVLAVLGTYFVRRFGWRGVVAGAVLALPVLLLGGRDTEEAATSTLERVESWYAGMEMLRASPLLGIGLGRYLEHHYLTAHNSWVLTAAELGFPGLVLWSGTFYLSLKVPLQALWRARSGGAPPAPVALSWSQALAASLAGVGVGMFFLSYAYKDALWIFMGLSGSLHQAIRRHDPEFRVGLAPREAGALVGASAVLVAAFVGFTRAKLGG